MSTARWLRALGLCLIGVASAAIGGSAVAAPEPRGAAAAGPIDSTFYTLRPDLRRCAFPRCGGFFVKRVNRDSTRCADGSLRSECYVPLLELGALRLSRVQEEDLRGHTREFLLRGELRSRRALAVFEALEAWRGHAGVTPRGTDTFYRARDLGIVCVTFPCLSFTAHRLNSNDALLRLAGVDLEEVVADPSDGQAQLREPEGLMVAARRVRVSGPAGSAIALVASEYYLPFRGPRACGSRGLPQCGEGEYCQFPPQASCGEADQPGVCMPIPETCEPGTGPAVCGCDGQAYASACHAATAGSSVAPDERCDLRQCGGLRGIECEDGEFCDLGPGQCSTADMFGVCRTTPEICTDIFAPVCGCDGTTHGNLCTAQSQGAQIDHLGECEMPAPPAQSSAAPQMSLDVR